MSYTLKQRYAFMDSKKEEYPFKHEIFYTTVSWSTRSGPKFKPDILQKDLPHIEWVCIPFRELYKQIWMFRTEGDLRDFKAHIERIQKED